MEHTILKRITLPFLCLIFCLSAVQAQSAKKAAATKIQKYHQKEIAPVMQQTRAALDAYISLEDQKEIDGIKASIAASQVTLDADVRKSLSRDWNASPAAKRTYLASQKLNLADRARLQELAAIYFDDVDVLLADLHNQKKAWDADIIAIKEVAPSKIKARKAAMSHKNLPDEIRLFQKASFLLLDYPKVASVTDRKLAVFPNPASSGRQQLSFEVAQTGLVSVDIVNLQGQVVQNVFTGSLDAGNQLLNVDLDDRIGNQFVYRISDQHGVTAKSASKL